MAKATEKSYGTRSRGASQPFYYESDDNEPRTRGDEGGEEAFEASRAGEPARPRGRPRSSKTPAAQPVAPANPEEPEYLAAFRGTHARQQKIVWNAAYRAIHAVEKQRDEAREERDTIKADSRRHIQVQEDTIRGMREAGLKRVQELGLSIESDDDISAHLHHLWSRVKWWAKLHGVSGAAKTLSKDYLEGILTILTSSAHASTSRHAFYQVIDQGIPKTTLLNAVFGKLIFDKLLDGRFFFLKGIAGKRTNADLDSALMDLYDLGSEVDPDQSKVWMSQTMAMLHSRKTPVTEIPVRDESKVNASKQQSYKQLTMEFLLHETLTPLMKPSEGIALQHKDTQALQIVSDFGNYLLKLSIQKVRMETLSYDNLKDVPFSISNECTRPHPTLGLDVDDKSLDNQAILLVVEPGIQAYGNEEGRNYSHFKTWSPAVVIVALKPDSNKKNVTPSIDLALSGSGSHSKTLLAKDHQKPAINGQVTVRKRPSDGDEDEEHINPCRKKRGSGIPPLDGPAISSDPVDQDDDKPSAQTNHLSTTTTDMDGGKQSKVPATKFSIFQMELNALAAKGLKYENIAGLKPENPNAQPTSRAAEKPHSKSLNHEQSAPATRDERGDAMNPVHVD